MSANRKIVVGLFVISGFFLFALGLFWIGDRRLLFSESIGLQTRFANLSGLKVGSRVMVSGMGAGEVLAIQVPSRPSEKFGVRFRILSQFKPMLRADSVASIQVEGLVGSKVLQVEAGSDAAPAVNAGAVLPSREPVEISAVIQESVTVIKMVEETVGEVRQRVGSTIDLIADVGQRAQKLVTDIGTDADEILGTGKKISKEVHEVVDGVRKGKGLAGKVLTDDRLYARVESATKHFEATAANVNQTSANVSRASDDVRKIVADVQSRKLGETFQKTAANVEQATGRLKDVLAELRPPGGPDQRGLLDDIRDTLDNSREATSDMAENMEALKRNWFFRGYFNKRGFYDLDAISLADYRQGKIAPKRDRTQHWLHSQDLFQQDPAGRETLTENGLKKLAQAMVPFLRYSPNTLLMVEGYSGAGDEPEQFLRSRDRARLVRRHLIDRFGLKPNFVGAIPMGAVPSSDPPNEIREGVSLVFFPEKKK
jgi:phospholipid/cholesterol/gamma-HCH transport system substrate-binding protein